MLLRVILKNFLSFDDEMQFDMFPNIRKTQLSEHIYTKSHDIPILKQAAIYGANATGKSNLVKALEFLRTFVLDKDFIKNIELENFRYLLKENNDKRPISISIEFEYQKKFFFYEIEITEKKIEENLYESLPIEGRLDVIYKRKGSKIEFSKGLKLDDAITNATKMATEIMLNKNQQSSLLALNNDFPIIPDNRCKSATKWFKGRLEIIGVDSFSPTLIDLLRKDSSIMEFVRKLTKKLEIGADDINIKESDFDNWAQSHIDIAKNISDDLDKIKSMSLGTNNTPLYSFDIENGIRKVYQLLFNNIGKKGFIGNLDINFQSDGTKRALTLLPALYYACKKEKTVVIDEINCCLSPTMVKGIVEYFAKTNDTNGQLIFTTHDLQLLDEENILRSDEIWFVDKREGASILYTHNDFKEHHTISRFKGYNEGRYGTIRFVNLLDDDRES